MVWKGTFFFKNNNLLESEVTKTIKLRIEKLTPAVARLYFVNISQVEVAIPEGFIVRDSTNGVDIVNFGNSFFLAWSDNYTFIYQGSNVITLFNQRQWGINSAPDVIIIKIANC